MVCERKEIVGLNRPAGHSNYAVEDFGARHTLTSKVAVQCRLTNSDLTRKMRDRQTMLVKVGAKIHDHNSPDW